MGLWWQIDVEAPKAMAVWSAANDSGGRGVTQTSSARQALVRDRDGHALLWAKRPRANNHSVVDST
jgi:hypothetical protein